MSAAKEFQLLSSILSGGRRSSSPPGEDLLCFCFFFPAISPVCSVFIGGVFGSSRARVEVLFFTVWGSGVGVERGASAPSSCALIYPLGVSHEEISIRSGRLAFRGGFEDEFLSLQVQDGGSPFF
ncbi:unnamed protein product [Microthlaspi erraticum]|uniref:Uncharacterized protein n=1 Tax=Microthlaspi erraticum TaxID=1685480 RepID=A0A6D2HXW7_9BRAS|nr:unnamed protein product [Microthlaspi erraticum]